MTKLAIIGASYLQQPLIEKAKQMGIQTHVFAWRAGDIGERTADYFYPISIVEKDEILEKCRQIGIDGICSISSDLASITVNYVAEHLNLVGNSAVCTTCSTNKHRMRRCFELHHDPSPRSILVRSMEEIDRQELRFPVIVKPVDRSGSRGITRLESREGLTQAVSFAMEQGFAREALVEEYAHGREYSVECITVHGVHHFLTITRKYTTGSPHFIEQGHMQPSGLTLEKTNEIRQIVFHALDSLGVTDSASHSEVKVDSEGNVQIIEIGARMGGDCIGSDLVRLTTGVDFVRAVIDLSLGRPVDLTSGEHYGAAAIRFIFGQEDLQVLSRLKKEHPEYLIREEQMNPDGHEKEILDSSARLGYFLMAADTTEALEQYMQWA